ncbi:MAG: glycosyltransferase family 4 protein [Patescibacteria group bacterium]
MKILIATPIFPPEIGGPATYTKEIAERLKGQHQITVIAFAENPVTIKDVDLVTVNKGLPLPLRQVLFFKKIITLGKKADLIYVQNAMAAGVPSVMAAKLLHKPVILKFVGDGAWEKAFGKGETKKFLDDFLKNPDAGFKSKLRIWIQKKVLSNADRVIVPSEYLKNVLLTYYHLRENKVITIYNAADSEQEGSIPRTLELHNHQVLAVSRLVSWKGIDKVIEAIKILGKDYPDIKLVVAGDGPEMSNLKKLASDLLIAERVKFLGNVSRKETANLRRQSEVFVLNSVYEGLPHSVLSSFSAGIPVIATNIPGTNEAVYDGKTGLSIPPNDPQALVKAIKRIFEDKKLVAFFVANAKVLLREKFSWEAHIDKLLDAFRSLLIPRN